VCSDYVGPVAGAGVGLPGSPRDVLATPSAVDACATYPVASFHWNIAPGFRTAAVTPGSTRGIGPSGADNAFNTTNDVPGVVYDFVDAGSFGPDYAVQVHVDARTGKVLKLLAAS
jgi:hypothetical protein